jgi:hypothetical protein
LRTGTSEAARRAAAGVFVWSDGVLTVRVGNKRLVSEFRRLLNNERVAAETRRLFPNCVRIDVEEELAGPDATRQVLNDPELVRVVKGLDATVERVLTKPQED